MPRRDGLHGAQRPVRADAHQRHPAGGLPGDHREITPRRHGESTGLLRGGRAGHHRVAMLTESARADIVVMAAAVADYRPQHVSATKIKKDSQGDELQLLLVRNPDILLQLTQARRPGQTYVGFAAETESDPGVLLELARAKAARKGVDLLVVNRVGWDEGFGAEAPNQVVILDAEGETRAVASGTKTVVAGRVLDVVQSIRKQTRE